MIETIEEPSRLLEEVAELNFGVFERGTYDNSVPFSVGRKENAFSRKALEHRG